MIIRDNFVMALGDRLKAARKAAGMTQQQLAKAAGVSQGLISDLEKNAYPSSVHVPKMASILKVDALYLSDGVIPSNEARQEPKEYAVKPALEIAGMKINSMEENLLKHYSKLSGSSQRAVDLMVNHLYSLEHPDDLVANPTNGKKRKYKHGIDEVVEHLQSKADTTKPWSFIPKEEE